LVQSKSTLLRDCAFELSCVKSKATTSSSRYDFIFCSNLVITQDSKQ